MHKRFVDSVINIIKDDKNILGLAIGGSWIKNEIDEFSDIDLVLVTKNKIAPNKDLMVSYAEKFGNLLDSFTGEHVGENRLLICLYDNPLLHVDIKFIIPEEFRERVEDPIIAWERNNILSDIVKQTESRFPQTNFQWIEDRFWIWIHYLTAKIGRGELFEALDGLNFLRINVLAPLIQIKNGNLPRGYRHMEQHVDSADLEKLKNTIADYSRESIISCLKEIILVYKELSTTVYKSEIKLKTATEQRVMQYLEEIISR